MISLLYADSAAGVAQAPSPFMNFVPLLVILVIFYFLLIRPQQKKMTDHKKMLEGIKKGDRILTSSGFFAVVTAIGDSSVEVKLAENVKVKIVKSSIQEILGSQESNGSTVPAVSEKAG